MDTSNQLHEIEATGWRRGLYADVERTFRAPFVNWIFRTATANAPAFTRYAWGQVKPLFQTRGFARLSVAYRDAALGALEADGALPTYRRPEADLSPAEYAQLRGQLATFDVVAPRLAVLFEAMDRSLHGGEVGTGEVEGRAATEPYPEWLDRDRGRPPSMVDEPPSELSDTAERVAAFHGFEGSFPSIYRCLFQWPSFTDRLWDDLAPRFESAAFERTCDRTDDLVAEYVERAPYRPALDADALDAAGIDSGVAADAGELFRQFNTGPVETVLPALPVFAATVGADGERSL